MSLRDYSKTLNNRDVFEFYESHPSLDFETMNVLLVRILQDLMRTMTDPVQSESVNAVLMSKMHALESALLHVQGSVSKAHSDLSSLVTIKMAESSRDYNVELRALMASQTLQQQQVLEPILQRCNQEMLSAAADNMRTLLASAAAAGTNGEPGGDGAGVVAGSTTTTNVKLWLDAALAQFRETMLCETARLIASGNSTDAQSLADFRQTIAARIAENNTVMTTLIASSESRLEQKLAESERRLAELRELTSTNVGAQSALHGDVQNILRKFDNSSGKGNVSETLVHQLLLGLFPSADIQHVGNELKETGDILFTRTGKERILIENKDHESRNVGRPEVEKFIRDCDQQDCCGIMMAQHRGIANKENFELQLNNGKVLLYMHKVSFDPDLIKVGIEIVESFKAKLDELRSQDTTFSVPKELMDEINREYAAYALQKQALLKLMRDSSERMLQAVQELALPSLEKYLQAHFAFAGTRSDNTCQFCDKFIPRSLAHHLRYCDKNPGKVGGAAGVAGVAGPALGGAADGEETGGGSTTVGASARLSASASSVKSKLKKGPKKSSD